MEEHFYTQKPLAASQRVLNPSLTRLCMVLGNRHFSPFKMFIAHEQQLALMLNPKVGTTTFRHVVRRAYSEVLGQEDVSQGRYKWVKKARYFPIPPLQEYVQVIAHPEGYEFCCFVRNPYVRLKSAWRDKLARGHEEGYPPSMRRGILALIRYFARTHGLEGGKANSPVPFSTFVAYIASQKTGKRNHHWDEQYSILLMDHFHYSQIFKMETQFVEGTAHILAQLGVPKSWTEEALAKPYNEGPKSEQQVYTPELAAQVQNIYARDFAVLGYDVRSWKGL